MSDLVLAVDVGGTKAHGALLDPEYRIVAETQASTVGRDPGLRATRRVVDALLARADGDVRALAVGVPEYVSPAGRLTSREVLDWTEQPAEALRPGPAVPTTVLSDVRAGALGELTFGRGAGVASFFSVSLGTGLSSAFVLEGRIWTGARGEAIALGELGVPAVVDPTWNGNLEAYASGTGVTARFAALTGDDVTGGARDVVARAATGDAIALEVLTTAGAALGHTLAGIVALLDPALIVLGGGLGTADTPLTASATATFDALVARRSAPPALVSSGVPHNAALLGCAAAAWSLATGTTSADTPIPFRKGPS